MSIKIEKLEEFLTKLRDVNERHVAHGASQIQMYLNWHSPKFEIVISELNDDIKNRERMAGMFPNATALQNKEAKEAINIYKKAVRIIKRHLRKK